MAYVKSGPFVDVPPEQWGSPPANAVPLSAAFFNKVEDALADTGWITDTAGFAPSTGWTINSVIYRNRGGVISGMVTITRATGAATLVGPSDGNITDVEVLTAMPANACPGQRLVQLVEGAGPGTAMVYETGRVVLRTLHANASIAAGSNIIITMSYLGA